MQTLAKWLAAVAVGGVVAALQAILAKLSGSPAGVDPVLATVVVAVLTKVINWLIGKVPVGA